MSTVCATVWAVGMAVLDLNDVNRAELESVRGIGVATAARVLEAREAGRFVDWADVRRRVKGLPPTAWQGMAERGLVLNCQSPPGSSQRSAGPPPAAPSHRPGPTQ